MGNLWQILYLELWAPLNGCYGGHCAQSCAPLNGCLWSSFTLSCWLRGMGVYG